MENGVKNHDTWRIRKFQDECEEPPLEVHYYQDKTQEQFRRQSSLITQAKFLFLI